MKKSNHFNMNHERRQIMVLNNILNHSNEPKLKLMINNNHVDIKMAHHYNLIHKKGNCIQFIVFVRMFNKKFNEQKCLFIFKK